MSRIFMRLFLGLKILSIRLILSKYRYPARSNWLRISPELDGMKRKGARARWRKEITLSILAPLRSSRRVRGAVTVDIGQIGLGKRSDHSAYAEHQKRP